MTPNTSRYTSILLILLILFVTIVTVLAISSENQAALKGSVQEELRTVANITASRINGDRFSQLRPGDERSPEFITVRDALRQVRAASPGIHYIYTMRETDTGVEFVVDGDYGFASDAAAIGEPYLAPPPELVRGFSGPSADSDFTTDQWGTFLSGYSPIRDHTGRAVGIVGVDMDSTVVAERIAHLNLFLLLIAISVIIASAGAMIMVERRRISDERNLSESEKRYRLLFERAGDAIFLLDANGGRPGKIVAANHAASEMYGYSAGELRAISMTEIQGEQNGKRAEMFGPTLSGEWIHREMTHRRKDGTPILVELSAGLLDLGERKFILAFCRDISARKRVENALQRASGKLSILNQVTFNDIRNAVFCLQGYLELEQPCQDGETPERFRKKEMDAISQIVRSLDFARKYQDLGMSPPRWHDVNQTFLYAISHLVFDSIRRTVTLDDLEIYADPYLEQVFVTLAENTLVHGGTATEVSIRYRETPEGLLIFYEDNGKGIPPERKETIFERGHQSRTGMGLFLIREILGITGITIRETGIPGAGARFEILVPKGGFRFGQS